MRFLSLGILLAFPVVDLVLTARLAEWSGVPLWLWLVAGAIAGTWLIRSEHTSFRRKTIASMHGQQSLLRSVLDSGRKVLAGVLLILPGVMSDVVALTLLALPINLGSRLQPQPAGAGAAPRREDTLEGDFRRVD
jgi:UPF0716 protein FxsA